MECRRETSPLLGDYQARQDLIIYQIPQGEDNLRTVHYYDHPRGRRAHIKAVVDRMTIRTEKTGDRGRVATWVPIIVSWDWASLDGYKMGTTYMVSGIKEINVATRAILTRSGNDPTIQVPQEMTEWALLKLLKCLMGAGPVTRMYASPLPS